MRKLRLLLLPFGAIAELVALAVCWLLVLIGKTRKAQRLVQWATSRLPDLPWYIGK